MSVKLRICSSLLGVLLAGVQPAQASPFELTDLNGVTATAGSCYLGCNNQKYDASNILDGDYGATGNTGLNSWNSGFYGGWVQVNLTGTYLIDRIELYGGYGYYNPFSLSISADGSNWQTVGTGGYGLAPGLSQTGEGGVKYGAIFDLTNSNYLAQYVRYSVTGGSPHWGYLYEIDVKGHEASTPSAVPLPAALPLMLSGLGILGFASRRRKEAV